jgi:hypothetical protein
MRKRRNFTILGIFSRTELPRGSLRGNAEACAAVYFGFVSMRPGAVGEFCSGSGLGFLFVLLGWVLRCRFASRWGSEIGMLAAIRCSSLEVEVARALGAEPG